MNIPRRIKLLGAAGALSLASVTGLIAAAPAQALTVPPHRPTLTPSSYTYNPHIYPDWLQGVSLSPVPATSCTSFTLTGANSLFGYDTSVYVTPYAQDQYGNWDQLATDPRPVTAAVDGKSDGAIIPTTFRVGHLPWPLFPNGLYDAVVTDAAGNGGFTFNATCP